VAESPTRRPCRSRHPINTVLSHAAFLAETDPAASTSNRRRPPRQDVRDPLGQAAPTGFADRSRPNPVRTGIAQALGVAIPFACYLAAALLVIGLTLWRQPGSAWRVVCCRSECVLALAVVIVTAVGPALRVPALLHQAMRTPA
jgi:hypothetical protein